MLPTCCPPTMWAIYLKFRRDTSILETDNFLGTCCRKAVTPKSYGLYLFPDFSSVLGEGKGRSWGRREDWFLLKAEGFPRRWVWGMVGTRAGRVSAGRERAKHFFGGQAFPSRWHSGKRQRYKNTRKLPGHCRVSMGDPVAQPKAQNLFSSRPFGSQILSRFYFVSEVAKKSVSARPGPIL